MSIRLELVDLEQEFRNLKNPPILANDYNLKIKTEKDALMSILQTRYDGESLESVPSCECGEITGRFNLGVHCELCQTEVTTIIDSELECSVWLMAPTGVRKFFNPNVWMTLKNAFTISDEGTKISLMDWLCDSHYQVKDRPRSAVLDRIPDWPRSLNFVIDNFDMVFEHISNLPALRKRSAIPAFRKRDLIAAYVQKYRDKLFTSYLPIPSRAMFITENTAMGRYVDPAVGVATDAILTVVSAEHSVKPIDLRGKEHRAVKCMNLLCEYYQNFMDKKLGGKPGLARKLVFGGRTHWTGRAVVSSITGKHAYDEVHLCWGLAVQMFEMHLRAKLIWRGYTPKQMDEIFFTSVNTYNPLLDELFHELINEGNRPPTIIIQRNPTLKRGAAQRMYVTKIETDTSVKTNRISILSIKAPNCDFPYPSESLAA